MNFTTFQLHENHLKDDLKNHFKYDPKSNFKDGLAFSKSLETFPLTKKMWEIMLRLDGPTFAFLCWLWCPHSKNIQ